MASATLGLRQTRSQACGRFARRRLHSGTPLQGRTVSPEIPALAETDRPTSRRVLVWARHLDPAMLPALRAQGIEIVCQLGGNSGVVPAIDTETLFSATAPQLRWIPPAERFVLPVEVLNEYIDCIFRVTVIPGTRNMDTSALGTVFGDNAVDWAQIHACVLDQILVDYEPDEVWFVDHRHLGLDHLMAFLADRRKVPVLFLMQSRVPCKFQVFRWQAGRTREVDAGEFLPVPGGAQPAFIFNQPPPRPPRMKLLATALGKFGFYALGWIHAGWSTWSERVYKGLIRKGLRAPMLAFDLCDRRTRPVAWTRFLRWRRHRAWLRERRFASPEILARPFVFFPLQYEPESALLFGSGEYRNQINAIEAIVRLLPDGWSLLVKENPLQTGFARSEAFFLRLRQLPQVHFVADGTSSLEMIRASRLVMTLTGTAGYEALLEGRASVHFGLPWYHGLPGTHRYSEDLDLLALASSPPDRARLDRSMEDLLRRMPDGLIFPRFLEMLDPAHDRAALCAQTAASLRRVSNAVQREATA